LAEVSAADSAAGSCRDIAFALALPTSLAAQAPARPGEAPASIEIRGRIVDTAGAPLPHAWVSLRPKGSTTTIAGAIAGRDGSFRIAGLRPGTFSIRVAYIGYAPVIEDLILTPDKPIVELGVAKLAPMAMALSDVEVQEERATVVTEPDRNTYTAKDIAPGASNASELLENVPSVQVDVIAYGVSQRTHEISLRVALGARRLSVARLVMQQSLVMSGIGIVLGLAGAVALARLARSMLVGVDAFDPLTLIAATLLIGVVSLLAGAVPVRRALRVDPITTLR
jgi:hypothetical protein